MKITPKFTFVSGSFDTDEVKMLCLPSDNHGKVDLCIKEKDCAWNIPIGGVKLHDRDLYVDFKATLKDATNLGNEIARRWNEHEEWHECKEDTDDVPKTFEWCLLRVEYVCDGEKVVDYLTSSWNFGWTGDYLDKIADNYEDYKITHWKHINRPKGVEE